MNDILFGNNNGAVIKKLSGRYFKASKSRNIIAIIAIILTTILFTTISPWVPAFWTRSTTRTSARPAVTGRQP